MFTLRKFDLFNITEERERTRDITQRIVERKLGESGGT
jgi:hypothetical protein